MSTVVGVDNFDRSLSAIPTTPSPLVPLFCTVPAVPPFCTVPAVPLFCTAPKTVGDRVKGPLSSAWMMTMCVGVGVREKV